LGQLCAAGWPTLPAHAAHLPWHPLAVVGKRPCLVIFVSLLLTILGAVRLLLIGAMGPLPSVVEQDQLWVPQEAQAITDKNKYEAAFSTTYRRNTLYFTTKPPGGNILTSDFLKEVYRFDHMVTNDLNVTGPCSRAQSRTSDPPRSLQTAAADGDAGAAGYGNSGPKRDGSYDSLDLDDHTLSESGVAVTYEDVCAKSDMVRHGRNGSARRRCSRAPPVCGAELWPQHVRSGRHRRGRRR
jgi:hypothetical protein